MHFISLVSALALVIASAACEVCRDEYLIGLTNSSLGIKLTLLPRDNSPHKQNIETVTIQNQFLSPECGDNYFRCKDLTVVRKRNDPYSRQHVVLVPIQHGILLVDLKYNGLQLTLDTHHILDSPTCSPTAFFETSGTVFTVCLDLETRYLTLLELHLNTETIHSSQVSGPLLTFNQLQDPPDVSNFVFTALDSDSESQFIYFSTGSYVHILLPFLYLHYQGQVLPRCSKANMLVLANTVTLVAYCENNVVYYSTFESESINQTLYSVGGRPFLCPDNDAHLSVFTSSSFIAYGLWSDHSLQYFDIAEGFDTGACFGPALNRTLFVYSADDGVSVLDTLSSTITPIFSRSSRCSDFKFEPILVFDERYIVVREKAGADGCDASVTVMDSHQNYSAVITDGHVQADLLTMVVEETNSHLVCDQISPEVTIALDGPEFESEDQSTVLTDRNIGIMVGVTVSFSAVVVFIIIAVVFILLLRRRKNWINKESRCTLIQDGTHNSEMVGHRTTLSNEIYSNNQADEEEVTAMQCVVQAQQESSSSASGQGDSSQSTNRETESLPEVSSVSGQGAAHQSSGTPGTQQNATTTINTNNNNGGGVIPSSMDPALESLTRKPQEERDSSCTSADVMVTGTPTRITV